MTQCNSNRPKGKELARPGIQKQIAIVLPDEQTSPEQFAIYRRMTPEQRWHAARRPYWTCRRHKAAFLRSQHPDWPEQRVQDEVRRIFLYEPEKISLP